MLSDTCPFVLAGMQSKTANGIAPCVNPTVADPFRTQTALDCVVLMGGLVGVGVGEGVGSGVAVAVGSGSGVSVGSGGGV